MRAITVIELRRYGWRQKIVRRFFIIHGKSPYVKSVKPRETLSKVLRKKKCKKCYVAQDLFVSD